MSNQHSTHGKREAPSTGGKLQGRYKTWLGGLNRAQSLRYRLLQGVVILAVVVIAAVLFLKAWVRLPEVPGADIPSGPSGNGEDTSADFALDGAELPDIVRSGRKEGVYTFLVAGRDVISGSTDTILLVTYDTKEKTIQGLNLPRDTMVNVSTASKRINAVYNYNRGKDKDTQIERGMAALKSQVAKVTGITPDFYILVEWEAIGELVDALGGVWFDVPFDMDYDDPTPGQELHIHQQAGYRRLTGDDAMQVIRHRKNNDGSHSNGDVGRLKIQQDFLMAVAKECLQPKVLLKAPALAKIFMENVATDLEIGYLLGFAQSAYGMDPEEGVSFVTAPLAASFTYRGAALVTLDGEGILKIVNNGMNPYLRDIELSDLELVYRKSNGSFGVTSGTLADEKMAQVPVQEPVESEEPEEVENPAGPEPEEPENHPGEAETPEQESPAGSGGSAAHQPGEQEHSGKQESTPSQDVRPEEHLTVQDQVETQPAQQEQNKISVLPARPRPVQTDAA